MLHIFLQSTIPLSCICKLFLFVCHIFLIITCVRWSQLDHSPFLYLQISPESLFSRTSNSLPKSWASIFCEIYLYYLLISKSKYIGKLRKQVAKYIFSNMLSLAYRINLYFFPLLTWTIKIPAMFPALTWTISTWWSSKGFKDDARGTSNKGRIIFISNLFWKDDDNHKQYSDRLVWYWFVLCHFANSNSNVNSAITKMLKISFYENSGPKKCALCWMSIKLSWNVP